MKVQDTCAEKAEKMSAAAAVILQCPGYINFFRSRIPSRNALSSYEVWSRIVDIFDKVATSKCIHPDYETNIFENFPYIFSIDSTLPIDLLCNLSENIWNQNIHNFDFWTYYVEGNKITFGFKTVLDSIMAKLFLD